MIAWIKVEHRTQVGRGPRDLQHCGLICDIVDALRKRADVKLAEHFSSSRGTTGKGYGYVGWIDVLFDYDGTDQIADDLREQFSGRADRISLIL